jgi:hypothetical protein
MHASGDALAALGDAGLAAGVHACRHRHGIDATYEFDIAIEFSIRMLYIGRQELIMKPENLEERLAKRIARKRGDVFLRADFSDLGGYDQVGRALRGLVRKGRLMKVGYGLYTRTRPSLLDGKPLPAKGIRELAAEALGRLGIETAPTRLEEAYNAGKTTQVPTGRVVAVRGRVRRKISYNGFPLSYERAGPAAR